VSYLTTALTTISGIAGVVVGIAQLSSATRQARLASTEVRRLAEDQERAALQSDDIKTLGHYLYENIGSTQINSYVSNKQVRDRVSRALESVLGFLGTEETEVIAEQSEEVAQEVPDTATAVSRTLEEERSEMARSLDEMSFGEVWNGLARMRRHIESELRRITPKERRYQNQPAGRLLTILHREGLISDRAEKLLRYAINVANAGIHGSDISVGQAQEAWEAGVRGLTGLPSQHQSDG
jgi:hypothetical protein